MTSDAFPAVFTRYAAEVADNLGAEVGIWITFNEPSQLLFGYIKPWWESNYPVPPGLPPGAGPREQADAIGRLIRNLFLAHTSARAELLRANPGAKVGANPLALGLPAWLQRRLDRHVIRIHGALELERSSRRVGRRPVLERGAVDVVLATMTRTRERERSVLFSEPYFTASVALMVLTGSTVRTMADLAGKVVNVVKGSTAESFADVFEFVVKQMNFTILCAITGMDHGATMGVIYHLAREGGCVLNLSVQVPKEKPVLRTVTGYFPAAEAYERELADLFGFQVEGLPPGSRYPLPDDWPQGQYPLRKEWKVEMLEGHPPPGEMKHG